MDGEAKSLEVDISEGGMLEVRISDWPLRLGAIPEFEEGPLRGGPSRTP